MKERTNGKIECGVKGKTIKEFGEQVSVYILIYGRRSDSYTP